jgi:hypothetical protein
MAGGALAQSGADYGYDFALIGDPGNRVTRPDELPKYPETRIGGVDHEFWMATTEVTVGQHLEFVISYYPFYVKNTGSPLGGTEFTGNFIRAAFGEIHILPNHFEGQPTNMSWEYAARYINWLHHGKVTEEWAFETGVYDTSTFVQDDDENWLHQAARNPGSRFWMPTFDEWTKAGYWDPNKNNGEGGYWLFQNTSDIEPYPGLPDEGGSRNAGDSDEFPLAVGSFPQVKSPWGLYDMSGGQSEFTETPTRPDRLHRRILCGTDYLWDTYGDPWSRDILSFGNSITTFNSKSGLRLGTTSGFHSADLNADGHVNFFDISLFIQWFVDADERVDFRQDGVFDIDDVRVYLGFMGI